MLKAESPLSTVTALAAGLITARFLWKSYNEARRANELQTVADQARARRDAKVHKVLQDERAPKAKLPDGTPYEQLSAAQVVRFVNSGELDPVELVRFLSKRCARFGKHSSGSTISMVVLRQNSAWLASASLLSLYLNLFPWSKQFFVKVGIAF